MRWDYNEDYRDMFGDGVHRDILIVPHATSVTGVKDSQPIVRSKVPLFAPGESGQPLPGQYKDLEFIITNDDIIKEKFEFSRSINSADNLAFGSCESAMIKFSIRNNKNYNEETGLWEPEIPNLQKIEVVSEDGKVLQGEVEAAAIIEVYAYINNDSSTLMWLGMYKVEEDKVTNNGYEREIVAYDFMLTFRDMDIYEWYKGLFKGIPKDSDDPSKGYVKAGKDEWTIGEALNDLLENLAYLSPKEPTITNPKDYLVDMDAKDYPGYGMPIVLDPDLTDATVDEIVVPEESDADAYERYGYMPILNLPFHEDEKIIKKGSYSAGKFLEDIAMLAGRFGIIRRDKRVKSDYVPYDPSTDYHYNHYDKCILSFRPIEQKDADVASENMMDNSDIQKGFQHDDYDVQEIKLLEITNYDSKSIGIYCPTGLSEEELKEYKSGKKETIPAYVISENTFTSYLKLDATTKSSTQTLSNKEIIDALFKGVEGVNDGKPFLDNAFNNMIYRPYRPYQMTTFGDLCREPGDRINVSGYDPISGEEFEFTSYIFEIKTTGIQKMMDTYTTKGNLYSQSYSDYRSGTTASGFRPQSMGYGRGGGDVSGGQSAEGVVSGDGMTAEDFVAYIRNIGFRLLQEPTKVKAIYSAVDSTVSISWKDPDDMDTWRPIPVAWEGTIVVRKEGSPPRHRWDGDVLVDSTTRDEYSETPFIDNNNVEINKKYYYGIFPYYTADNIDGHDIKHYRFTKSVLVETTEILKAPEIKSIISGTMSEWDGSELDIMWSGDNSKLSVKVENDTITFTMYSGSTEIYSFDSPVGSTPADVSKIHVAFLEDETNHVAKPSFVYRTGSGVYSYNLEEPTDAEMGNIYLWLYPPEVPPEYQSKVDAINSYNMCGITNVYEKVTVVDSNIDNLVNISTPFTAISTHANSDFNNESAGGFADNTLIFCNALTVYVTTSGSGATVEYANFNGTIYPIDSNWYGTHYTGNRFYRTNIVTINGVKYLSCNGYNSFPDYRISSLPSLTTSFSSLSDAIDYLYKHFRHIGLYVDDKKWI